MRRRNRNLLLYLLLNVILSAVTTLTVLFLWDRAQPVSRLDGLIAPGGQAPLVASTLQTPFALPTPTVTLPPNDQPLIEIVNLIGAGDAQQEVVLLRRVGEGDLHMAGWQLQDQDGNRYEFPQQPELVLYKGGAVQVFTRTGADTATEVYWNRTAPVWRSGEQITLLDSAGNVRATYPIP